MRFLGLLCGQHYLFCMYAHVFEKVSARRTAGFSVLFLLVFHVWMLFLFSLKITCARYVIQPSVLAPCLLVRGSVQCGVPFCHAVDGCR